jgi:serine/threonine-protein kinase
MRQCLLCSRQYEDDVQFCPHDGAAMPPPDDFVGRLIDDKYRIEALHGTGGMGAVYLATQVALDRRVALKVVKGDFLKDPVVTERFKREALAVARLKHPHIVTVYDFGFTPDGAAYLVMEFLEGRTLRQEIHARGRVPAGPAVDLMRQVCAAVSAAHAEGIIHRDLKPDNIFLEQGHDGALTVKILDFGIAKLKQNSAEGSSHDLAMGGVLLGTPLYMSPEQCQGESLDQRSDIYSLGCVFYEMLAGRPPFTGDTATQLIVKHVSEEPAPLDRLAPNAPPELAEILMKAIAKAPEARHQTAAELGAALATVEVPLETQASFPPLAPDAVVEAPASTGGEVDSLVDNLFSGERRFRLAVLPFRNLAKDASVDFLSISLSDAIITELSTESRLVVRPTAAVEQYLDTTIEQGAVSAALEVDLLVTGTFLKQGDVLQVSAQLVDVASNEIRWRHRSTESSADILALQDAIVDLVAAGVRSTLLRSSGTVALESGQMPAPGVVASGAVDAAATPVGDPVALDLYREASELGQAAEERQRAIDMLERAVALDPDMAVGWSALASRYYSGKSEMGKGIEYGEKALRAAERAVTLDRGQLGSVVALGRLLVESGNAEDVARRASAVVAERADSFAARVALAYACRFGGLLDRSLREYRLAEQLDPDFVAREIATIYLQKQLFTDALRVLDESISRAPTVQAHFLSALSWALLENAAGARDSAGELALLDPNSIFTVMAEVLAGRLDGAATGPLVGRLDGVEPQNPEVSCWLAQVLVFTGETATAAARLAESIAGGYFNYPYFQSDPLIARIRSAPELAAPLEAARERHESFVAEFGSQ